MTRRLNVWPTLECGRPQNLDDFLQVEMTQVRPIDQKPTVARLRKNNFVFFFPPSAVAGLLIHLKIALFNIGLLCRTLKPYRRFSRVLFSIKHVVRIFIFLFFTFCHCAAAFWSRTPCPADSFLVPPMWRRLST